VLRFEHVFESVAALSELRSALDQFRAVDVLALSDEALADRLDEIERSIRMLEAERGRDLAEADRRKTYANDGHLSTATWLAHRQGLSPRAAEGQVRRARALAHMPRVAEALSEGEVSASVVNVLASAHETAPEAFARSEDELLEAARTTSFGEFHRVVSTWKVAAAPERAMEEEDRRYERRHLNMSPAPDGMVMINGELDPDSGQHLITALRAVVDVEARNARTDARTPAQRRADALGQICRQWLGSPERPTVAGERPHVVVTVDLETLLGRPGRGGAFEDTGSITPATARQLACDANVTRVITRGTSEPLELGRRTKVVPAPLRRAVAVRDRGCRFPGCGRPPGWCDAHHVRHWADGGETSLSNLILLCRPHHRAIHRGFGVRMAGGTPVVFTRPDGAPIPERAPP
jgi:hypothetical protein